MATRKGVELRTDFTGSDKNFKPVLERTKRGVKSLGKEAKRAGTEGAKGFDKLKLKLNQIKTSAGKAKGALIAVAAVGAGVTKANESARNDLQNAQMANMDVERFQKLAFVLKGFRIEADETADILRELKNVTKEALDEPTGGKASAFKMLQIDAEKFAKLGPVEQLQAFAEAQKRLTDDTSVRGFDEAISDMGRNLAPVFQLSNEEFVKRLKEAPAVPEEIIRAQINQFEIARGIKGKGINKLRMASGLSTGQNPLQDLKEQNFKLLGKGSPFDPSIKFDPVGDKEKEDEKKTQDKIDKSLEKLTKPNSPMTLMGLTVDGKGVRPVENKMLTVMEKLAKLDAKIFKVESETLDLLQEQLTN
jgi:hypothetical protein